MSLKDYLTDEEYEFIVIFNRATGSDRIFYMMLDPVCRDRMFPKVNTTRFLKLRNLVGYKPIVLNKYLYIVGGKDWVTGEMTGSTWRYDPATSRWKACAAMLECRCRCTADVLNGKIYVTGGEVGRGRVTNNVEVYDPQTDTWTPIKSMPRPRVDHASCVTGNRLYVSGGISNLKHQCSNVFWVYDPLTDSWSDPCPHVASPQDREKRVVYDPLTDSWSDPCPDIVLPQEREKHVMLPKKDVIYIMAGRGFDQEVFREKDESTLCSYSTKNDGTAKKPWCWEEEHPNMFHTRVNPAALMLGHRIYLFGGKSFQKDTEITEVDYYNVKKKKWRTVFSLPQGHSFANVDCVKLTVPTSNRDFLFNDIHLYDKWILW